MNKKTVKVTVRFNDGFNDRTKVYYSRLPLEEAISHVLKTVRDNTPIHDLPTEYTIVAGYIDE